MMRTRRISGVLAAVCGCAVALGATADGLPPGVLAVCVLQLTDGETMDGVLSISRSSYRGYATDGFYVVHTRQDGARHDRGYLFGEDFYWIEPHTGRRSMRLGQASGDGGDDNRYDVYYLRDVSTAYSSSDDRAPLYSDDIHMSDSDGVRVLDRTKTLRSRYLLLDHVPLHATAPNGMRAAVQAVLRDRPRPDNIPLADIVRITLAHVVSEGWVAAISEEMAAWLAVNEDETGDTLPPMWYHDVIVGRGPRSWRPQTWHTRP